MVIRKSLSSVRYIKIIDNPSSSQTMATIKSNEAPHGICNASFFTLATNIPCCNELWIDGVNKANGNYGGFNLSTILPWGDHLSTYSGDFIGGYPSFLNGAFSNPSVIVEPTLQRERAVLARTNNDLIYYASLGATRDEMVSALTAEGVTQGVNLDGGASLQYSFDSIGVTSYSGGRKVPNFLLFWFKDQEMPMRKNGHKGFLVKEIQRLLTAKGFNTNADGVFGSSTEANVRAFQAAKGLFNPDGIVDYMTWILLFA